MERFIRGGIAAAVLGGLLVAAGAALTVVSAGHQQFSDQVLTGVFTVSAALRFTGAILMTWGIISLYLAQADRAGRLGLIAVVACMANMALQQGGYSATCSPHPRSRTPRPVFSTIRPGP